MASSTQVTDQPIVIRAEPEGEPNNAWRSRGAAWRRLASRLEPKSPFSDGSRGDRLENMWLSHVVNLGGS